MSWGFHAFRCAQVERSPGPNYVWQHIGPNIVHPQPQPPPHCCCWSETAPRCHQVRASIFSLLLLFHEAIHIIIMNEWSSLWWPWTDVIWSKMNDQLHQYLTTGEEWDSLLHFWVSLHQWVVFYELRGKTGMIRKYLQDCTSFPFKVRSSAMDQIRVILADVSFNFQVWVGWSAYHCIRGFFQLMPLFWSEIHGIWISLRLHVDQLKIVLHQLNIVFSRSAETCIWISWKKC